MASWSEEQASFLLALERFIEQTEARKQFRGKTQVLKALRRISRLACFQ